MAKKYPETISLKGEPIFKEGKATVKIYPGYLLQIDGENGVKPHSVVKGGSQRIFALENDLIGKEISDAYAIKENVRYGAFHQGQEVYAKLAARCENIKAGDMLQSDGKGTLQKSVAGAKDVACALESKNNSSSASETFIKVAIV